jgi:hypothetical protein
MWVGPEPQVPVGKATAHVLKREVKDVGCWNEAFLELTCMPHTSPPYLLQDREDPMRIESYL